MTFKELDVGDYFVQWCPFEGAFFMFVKKFDNAGPMIIIDESSKDMQESDLTYYFRDTDTVYNVIV